MDNWEKMHEATLVNWKTLLDEALKQNGESWCEVESNTMTEADMAQAFDCGYGGTEGCAFTLWTARSVYFPIAYDGSESVGRVARHPDGKPTAHLGNF